VVPIAGLSGSYDGRTCCAEADVDETLGRLVALELVTITQA
jgi:hypothetical protein